MSARSTAAAPATSAEVRARLVEALKLDLVGPWAGHAFVEEKLPVRVRPSSWYLTGFLIPSATPPEKSADVDEDEDLEEVPETAGLQEESMEEKRAAKKGYFPSSMGLSFLAGRDAKSLSIAVRWGDYGHATIQDEEGKSIEVWERRPREVEVEIALTEAADPVIVELDGSGGLQLHLVGKRIPAEDHTATIPPGTQSISLFLVNRRALNDDEPDLTFAFQAEIDVRCVVPFVPRPDPRGVLAEDWDELVADLHYADAPEYAVGHAVSAEWEITDGECRLIRTAWIPSAEVERTETVDLSRVELSMIALGALKDGAAAEAGLRPLVEHYRTWIQAAALSISTLDSTRKETAESLMRFAQTAAERIEAGISVLLSDAQALDAFRLANRAVAAALQRSRKEAEPRWRVFQLAFILLNLSGLADPTDASRRIVDLLFFPTGGGKTEAYLGLSAFVMVLRRLRCAAGKALCGSGVSVIMRYTLEAPHAGPAFTGCAADLRTGT